MRKSQYLPFQCWVLNKRTTGTIFITSLVWRSPWLGIEPGTSPTRCQHSTTRLSRRRSLTGDWTRDLPHSMPALFHQAIEEAVIWWVHAKVSHLHLYSIVFTSRIFQSFEISAYWLVKFSLCSSVCAGVLFFSYNLFISWQIYFILTHNVALETFTLICHIVTFKW